MKKIDRHHESLTTGIQERGDRKTENLVAGSARQGQELDDRSLTTGEKTLWPGLWGQRRSKVSRVEGKDVRKNAGETDLLNWEQFGKERV